MMTPGMPLLLVVALASATLPKFKEPPSLALDFSSIKAMEGKMHDMRHDMQTDMQDLKTDPDAIIKPEERPQPHHASSDAFQQLSEFSRPSRTAEVVAAPNTGIGDFDGMVSKLRLLKEKIAAADGKHPSPQLQAMQLMATNAVDVLSQLSHHTSMEDLKAAKYRILHLKNELTAPRSAIHQLPGGALMQKTEHKRYADTMGAGALEALKMNIDTQVEGLQEQAKFDEKQMALNMTHGQDPEKDEKPLLLGDAGVTNKFEPQPFAPIKAPNLSEELRNLRAGDVGPGDY